MYQQAWIKLGWVAALLLILSAAQAQVSMPDPVRFRIQMELGAIDTAREWLDAGMEPNAQGDRIGTGLMIAAWEGNIPLMALFLERGADIDRANALGETALMHAAWKGHSQAVTWLLDRGARVTRGPMQWTALHYATFAGHQGVAEQLIQRGADINARSPNGSSVLMMAVYEGREDMARRLLALGADTRVKNENGDGALEWAMKYNRVGIARLVSTQREFQVAANRPKAEWGEVRRSEAMPQELQELLSIRETLVARKLSLEKVDSRIAAMRAKYARESMKREPATPAVLEISAERKNPGKQRARIVIEPARRVP